MVYQPWVVQAARPGSLRVRHLVLCWLWVWPAVICAVYARCLRCRNVQLQSGACAARTMLKPALLSSFTAVPLPMHFSRPMLSFYMTCHPMTWDWCV